MADFCDFQDIAGHVHRSSVNHSLRPTCHNRAYKFIKGEAVPAHRNRRGTMKESSIIGDNGEKLSGHEAQAYELNAAKRKEDAQIERDLLAAMSGANLEAMRGRQNRGRARTADDDRRRKDKEEFESAVRAALNLAQERLERISQEITELNKRIRELQKDAEELRHARTRLERGESLEEVLRDQETLRKLDEYQRRTGNWIDLNDRNAVQEALRAEEEYRLQEAERYQDRVRELEQEKAEIEQAVSAIERSDVPKEQALKRMKEVLARETSAGVQGVWRDREASGQVKDTASVVYSRKLDDTGLKEADTLFPDSGGTSFAHQSGIGEGIETKFVNIKSQFDEAVARRRQENSGSPSMDISPTTGPRAFRV